MRLSSATGRFTLQPRLAQCVHPTRTHFGWWTQAFHQASRRKAALPFLSPNEDHCLRRRFESVLCDTTRYSVQVARLVRTVSRSRTGCCITRRKSVGRHYDFPSRPVLLSV